jgi:hypothetical protein
MRIWLAAILVAGLPALARGQDTTTAGVTVGGLPLPSIGLPLPSIGLPHPPMGLPPPQATSLPREDKRTPPPNGRHGGRGEAPPIVPVFMFPVFYTPPTPGVTGTSAGAPTNNSRVDPVQNGRVMLDVEPGDRAQLYVDGYYVGTPDDYREGLELPAGPHALKVRAPGFETASTSVQVPEGRVIAYRTSLTQRGGARDSVSPPRPDAAPTTADSSPTSATAQSPTTYYVIPGCYMGNVPPAEANFPPTCDPSRAVTIRH